MKDRAKLAAWLGVLMLAPATALSQDGCAEKLAALDEALAGDTTLPPPQISALEGVRETAARLCTQGGADLGLRMIDGAIETLAAGRTSESSASFTDSLPKDRLTLDYLAGEWCARQEQTGTMIPHLFADDGSYDLGMAVGQGYAMIEGGASIEQFRAGFDRLVSMEADAFVIADQFLTYRYERESCR